ncbi:MAG: hypothetical protein ACRES2_03375 [Steroidobacteraceae bacterium]
MTRTASVGMRIVSVVLVVVAYAILSHYSNAVPGHEDLGAVLAIAPVWIAAAILAWRARHRSLGLLACALAALLAFAEWRNLRSHFTWLYLIQQVGAYGLLGLSFGRSLAEGHMPLCTRFATLAHGSLSADAVRYTRNVTLAWTIFFCAMSAAVLIVYVTAPLPAWSVFANFCTAPLVGLMFIGEYLVRLRVLPDMQHASILGTVRAAMRGSGAA